MVYPATHQERDQWIVERRPARNALDPLIPYAFFNELECSANREVVSVSTVFLTNRECPWRCLMCDLWKNTLPGNTSAGAIPAQIRHALARLDPAQQIKLYNSGSFFDHLAVPPEEYGIIAGLLKNFGNVIVESHPALIGEPTLRFRDLVEGRLEVAIGLETVQEEVLARLNKRMTLQQFRSAAGFLQKQSIALRVFILVKPPFTTEEEALDWACRSIDFAFDCGASAVSLIPVRNGNGAMDELQHLPPRPSTVLEAFEYGLEKGRGRVFVDLWNFPSEKLQRMNLEQRILDLDA